MDKACLRLNSVLYVSPGSACSMAQATLFIAPNLSHLNRFWIEIRSDVDAENAFYECIHEPSMLLGYVLQSPTYGPLKKGLSRGKVRARSNDH